MGYILNWGTEKLKRWFYPGDMVTCTGERKIGALSGTFPDNPAELACMCFFEVTWHLTIKLFPAKISQRATLQNKAFSGVKTLTGVNT